jgi:CHAD domain-containing protein
MTSDLTRADADARGVRRVFCAQLESVIDQLGAQKLSDKQIHDARKTLKKARATLRLMKDAISSASYKRENAALRDAARPLSALRDARVLLGTLDRLEKLYGDAAKASVAAAFRRELKREQDSIRRSSSRAPANPQTLRKNLMTARKRISKMRLNANGWNEIGAGIERVYRRGRRAMKKAQKDPSAECLHEWRKESKYVWHQLQVLEPMCPGPLGELADQAHRLSDYLGDDHDLAVLRAKVMEHGKLFPGPGGPGALLPLIDRCQDRLRAKAFLLGERIYAEKPRAFSARLHGYWRRWQAQDRTNLAA